MADFGYDGTLADYRDDEPMADSQCVTFHLKLPAEIPDELLSDVYQAISDLLAEALPDGNYDLRDTPFPATEEERDNASD